MKNVLERSFLIQEGEVVVMVVAATILFQKVGRIF
jgi:hypothetical protein